MKPTSVLAYGFPVCFKNFGNPIKGDSFPCGYKKQNFNTIMIGHTLEMPLHLFCCLYLPHTNIIPHHIKNILTFSSLLGCCKCGGMC